MSAVPPPQEPDVDAGCPICAVTGEEITVAPAPTGATRIHCVRCGEFELPETVRARLDDAWAADPVRRAALSHHVRTMQRRGSRPVLQDDLLERLLEEPLPSITRQREELVLLLGREGRPPGEPAELLDSRSVQASIGAVSWQTVPLIGKQLEEEGLLSVDWYPGRLEHDFKASLTFDGWALYEELLEGRADSRTAFMALQFGDPVLDRLVNRVFRPAVRQTGFELLRADDVPRAGLIDDHMRVMIRRARFMVADLSHDNAGAYWEAGFAEGLGRPVIFTCERGKFEADATHFDTNHQHTIVWDETKPAEAGRDLKATIRATLPSEALLSDPEE